MDLSNRNIDKAVEDIRNFFNAAGVSRRDTLKICLVIEESLLRYQEHFGESQKIDLYMKKWFSAPKIIIRLKGKPFDPLQDNQEEDSVFSNDVMRNLLQYDAAGTVYRYENGYNEIVSYSTRERKQLKIPGGSVTISILLAIICSMLMQFFLSPETQSILINDVVSPILSTLMSLIITITVFMMFFSIVSSICAIEDAAMLSNIGITVLKRFFILSCMIIALAIGVSMIFFPIFSFDSGASVSVGEIIALFLSIIPTNILSAFSEGNVLQVAVLAFLTGVCVTIIGNRINNLKAIINDLNVLILKVMSIVFKVIPLVIYFCILKTLSSHDFSEFFVVWKIIAAELIVYGIFSVLVAAYMIITTGTKFSDFVKKISPAALIAFTTSSSVTAFPKNLEVAKDSLNVEEKFCDFFLPIALVLFAPSIIIEMVVCAFYAVHASHLTISVVQLLIIAFLAIQLSIATPKVAGSAAAAFTILLTQLHLSPELIGYLMISNILSDNVFSTLNVFTHDCELINVSHKMGFVNRD